LAVAVVVVVAITRLLRQLGATQHSPLLQAVEELVAMLREQALLGVPRQVAM
jgi:hypothetical protein